MVANMKVNTQVGSLLSTVTRVVEPGTALLGAPLGALGVCEGGAGEEGGEGAEDHLAAALLARRAAQHDRRCLTGFLRGGQIPAARICQEAGGGLPPIQVKRQ